MLKKVVFFVFLFFLYTPNPIRAIDNPLSVPNNRYGIHVNGEGDFANARELVNSNGGDWGYVTFVIREDERDVKRWNKAFNQLRQLHLIPLIRIASVLEGQGWKKLDPAKVNDWTDFLNKLTWVTENRYVIVGNEPNHNLEWGGGANPQEYAYYTCQLSQTLKAKNPNFFVISGGLDASAPNGKTTISEETFLNTIREKYPQYWDCLDGWSSHAYPNPNFSGLATAWGKGTVRTFLWEMETLKKLGVKKDYPVFITETGWAKKLTRYDGYSLNETQISQRIQTVAQTVWNHPQIVAVTPFILDYQTTPFANFSWKTKTGWVSYFTTYQNLPKTAGQPVIENQGEIILTLYSKINVGHKLTIFMEVKNTGQTVWQKDNFFINTDNSKLNPTYNFEGELWPNDKRVIKVEVTDSNQNRVEGNFFLSNGSKAISPKVAVSAFMIGSETTGSYQPPTPPWQQIWGSVTNWAQSLVK